MKKILALLAAALICLAAFTACSKGGGGNARPTSTPSNSAAPEPTTADGSNYDNSVSFTNGTLSAGAFNWQFFVGKSGAGRPAKISVISTVEGEEHRYELSFMPGAFTVTSGEEEREYTSLISFTADFEEGEFQMAEISVLTDEPEIDAETFFGGAVPQDVRVGDITDHGMVIYVNYK